MKNIIHRIVLAGCVAMLVSCSQPPAPIERNGDKYYGRRPANNRSLANDPYADASQNPLDVRDDAVLEVQDERKRDAYDEEFENMQSEMLRQNNATTPEVQGNFKLANPMGLKNFDWPLDGKVLFHYGSGQGKFREGIAISAAQGVSVQAAATGEVIYVGDGVKGFGKLIIIKHDGDFMTAYAHSNSVMVRKGEKVTRGQAIARVGKTGDVSSPQLYFSVRRGKMTIDPEKPLL